MIAFAVANVEIAGPEVTSEWYGRGRSMRGGHAHGDADPNGLLQAELELNPAERAWQAFQFCCACSDEE
jgi:hypothetical protein